MPYYKRKAASRKLVRKPYRKRGMVKRALNRVINRGTLVYRGNTGIADRALIRLKYRDNYVLTAGVPFAQQAWRLNSIYDPDFSGGGHQPLTYDQWGLFYRSYRVYKTDVLIQACNEEVNAVQLGWTVQPDDSAVDSTDSAFEQPHTFTKILGGESGQNRSTIKRTIHHPRILGQTSQQYKANENVYALFGYNPNTINYGILFAQSIDGTTLPNISVNVELIFHVELFDRKEMAISDANSPLKQYHGNN